MLQRAEQLHLRGRRRLADLVEEERALRRRAEQADLVANRAGERAFHVAEQLALEQALRKRAAVDREKRPLGARRQLVDVAGDDSPCPFPIRPDEHRGIGRRDGLDEPENVEPRLARADRPRDAAALVAPDRLLQRLCSRREASVLGGAAQDRDQLVVAERLLDVIEGAFVHRLHRRLQRRLRRHENDRHVRVALRAPRRGSRRP